MPLMALVAAGQHRLGHVCEHDAPGADAVAVIGENRKMLVFPLAGGDSATQPWAAGAWTGGRRAVGRQPSCRSGRLLLHRPPRQPRPRPQRRLSGQPHRMLLSPHSRIPRRRRRATHWDEFL